MIRFIHDAEARCPPQHPVGMTGEPIGNAALFDGPADWVSPTGKDGYNDDPPAAIGAKVIIADVDHIWPKRFRPWVGKCFLRGLNTAFMDPYGLTCLGDGRSAWVNNLLPGWRAETEAVRRALGHTVACSRQLDLRTAVPRPDLATSRYCLAAPGQQYLVYLPDGGPVTVDLGAASVPLHAAWFDPDTGATVPPSPAAGGGPREFNPPTNAPAVLFLDARELP